MPLPPKPTYQVQGYSFTLKPTSIENRELIREWMRKERELLSQIAQDIRSNMKRENLLTLESAGKYDRKIHGEIPEEIDVEHDEYAFYFEYFCMMTDGPHDQLDRRKFDIKITEGIKEDFLPEAYRTATSMAFSLL